jgi:protein TonB
LLLLLTLGRMETPRQQAPMTAVSFKARSYSEDARSEPRPEHKAAAARVPPRPEAPPPPAAPPSPIPAQVAAAQPPAAIIPVSPQQMATFDLSRLPRRPAPPAAPAPVMGPTYKPRFGESERVGTAPNGQPMYGARWYREPTDQELRGYLSTANGPGWGVIACKTVADFRVEDCVGLDEYPEGSHIVRAVLAAAWQFRVRPPRVGGVSQVGDWVRIRIDYGTKANASYADASGK